MQDSVSASLPAGYERKWGSGRTGGRSVSDATRDSYYGLPVIHKPHWKWEIYLYFFLGGISGGSYVIAAIARLVGGADGRVISRAGWYVSLLTLIPGPILLIMDLKKPSRFYNMLRVVKLRSPMSIGTWGLLLFSAFSGLSAVVQGARDGRLGSKWPARLLRVVPQRVVGALGIGPAFLVAGYTGVLLSATAVPLWAKNHLLMGPIFLTSAMSNAAAAVLLALTLRRGTPAGALERLERLETLAILAELCLLTVFKQRLGAVVGRPLSEGRFAALHRFGVLGGGLLAPLALQAPSVLLGTRPNRLLAALSSLLVLVGGFIFRYVMVAGGKQSADDPHATS